MPVKPRHVPRYVRLQLLFGMQRSLYGWALMLCAAGCFFTVHIGPYPRRAEGKVTYARPKKRGGTAVEARFHDDYDDRQRDAWGTYPKTSPQIGDTVMVAYDAKSAHIENSGWSEDDTALVVLPGLILLGLGLVASGVHSARRSLRLLRHGQLVLGKLVRSRELPIYLRTGKDHDIWLFTYEAIVADGRATRASLLALMTEPPPSEAVVIYDPERPQTAGLFGTITGSPSFTDDDQIAAERLPLRTWAGVTLILLTATTAALLAWRVYASLTAR